MYALTVTQPFADYKPGDVITDPKEVSAVLDSHPSHVVKVAADEPAARSLN